MTLAEYKLVAEAENPHWGKAPTKLPITGPNLPDFFMIFFVLSPVLL